MTPPGIQCFDLKGYFWANENEINCEFLADTCCENLENLEFSNVFCILQQIGKNAKNCPFYLLWAVAAKLLGLQCSFFDLW